MSSKEIITILNRLDVPVANHMSVMDDDMVGKVEKFFQDVKAKAAERHATEVERELREKQRARERAARQAVETERREQRGARDSNAPQRSQTSRPAERQQAPTANSPQPASARPAERVSQAQPETVQRQRQERVERQPSAQTSTGGPRNRPTSGSPQGRDTRDAAQRSQQRPPRPQQRSDSQGSRPAQRPTGRSDYRGPGTGADRGRPAGASSQGGGSRSSDASRGNAGGQRPARPQQGQRPASAGGAAGQKPQTGSGQRKDRPHGKQQYERKEQFNEDKLMRRGGGRRRGRGNNQGARPAEHRKPEPPKKITVEGPVAVGEFARLLRREASEIIKKLMFLGIMATINQEIETDAMELIAAEYGAELEVVEPVNEEVEEMLLSEDKAEDLTVRPPVVTIMGHVDHGKTTLLDAIRDSRVVASESGGITQHIGAYQIEIDNRKITFLDTPGHEAFTTMRARGAQVTDVTILVVAADDGVMPQTVEAINHAKAANVPIIVAVNKMDKVGANPDRVKQELTQYELVSEEWGGDTIFVEISALQREGLDNLLEMVLLVADVQELTANSTARPRGTVIEAQLDKGRGPVATVLVQNGTLRVGDIVVAGTNYGRIRAMVNDRNKRIKEAGPSTPVEIQGLNTVPSAGDLFVVYDDERSARNTVDRRTNRERAEQLENTSRVTLDDLYQRIKEGNMKDLNVIVKADVQGSVEALVQAIEKIDVEGVRVKVIHRGAGAITESDVSLASASNAIIVGFHVRPDVNAKRAAEAEKVDIRLHRVIYNAIEELESAMKGMLDPEFKEVVLGHAEVRQVFHISKVGSVAGCFVKEGKVTRDSEARLIRDGIVIYEGTLDTLKRFKDDAKEVAQGFECGLTLERFNDIKVGDIVEAFKMETVKAT